MHKIMLQSCYILIASLAISFSSVLVNGKPFFLYDTTSSRCNVSPFSKSMFGLKSRGGALFGNGSNKKEEVRNEIEKYPPLEREEIEEWLSHIPVYAVTDANGSGVVLKPDNETSVFYFFMSPQMANATLQQLKDTNGELDLRVSAFSLGKIWFRILKADKQTEVKLKDPGSSASDNFLTTKGVEYRLVPDTRDLLGARMLLTMDPEDGEKLKAGDTMTPEMANKAIQKAMTNSPKFNSTFNEIPVFMIQQMRMQKQNEEGNDPLTFVPMYFNLQNMVNIWQQFASQSPEAKDVEPAISLMDLFELVEKMQDESEIDFRHVVLVPTEMEGSTSQSSALAGQATQNKEEFNVPGATLGDV